MFITRRNFNQDIEKILDEMKILKEELKNQKEKGVYGNIGNIKFNFNTFEQVSNIIYNYKLPWYKISVEYNLCILPKTIYIKQLKEKSFFDGFKDQFILLFFGLPLATIFIIYQTIIFIHEKIVYVFY
jgi:hypothetical protein